MHIIVGIDDSAVAAHALRWAAWAAKASGASLEAVRSWEYPAVPRRDDLQPAEEMDRRTAAALEAAVDQVAHDGVTATTKVLRGPAPHALLTYITARQPSVTVLGRRADADRTAPRVLGSVSRRLVEAATCPVVVVSSERSHTARGAKRPVVMVAFDGSADAQRALIWATGFARAVGGQVLLAHVVGFVGHVEQAAPLADRAQEMLDRAADAVAAQGVTCATVVAYGDPRSLLEALAESNHADLIVIGPRGLGGIAKLVMGTVAAHLTQYADRPVAVVPAAWEASAT